MNAKKVCTYIRRLDNGSYEYGLLGPRPKEEFIATGVCDTYAHAKSSQAIHDRLSELEGSLNGDDTDDDTRADVLDEIADLEEQLEALSLL